MKIMDKQKKYMYVCNVFIKMDKQKNMCMYVKYKIMFQNYVDNNKV